MNVRDVQKDLLQQVEHCLEHQHNLIAHAPTGIGKTAAVLSPTIRFAIEHDLVVYFLTSRHTQHRLAIETIKKIQKANALPIPTLDLIGKKWLCLQPAVSQLYSGEFSEYCRHMKEEGKCEFYLNTIKKPYAATLQAQRLTEDFSKMGVWHSEEVVEASKFDHLCPYEVIMLMAKDAKIIIADYNYIFNQRIHDNLLSKIQKPLEKSIIIIDEGHNTPDRIRELLTERLSFLTLRRAVKEAQQHEFQPAVEIINHLQHIFREISQEMKENEEKILDRDVLLRKIEEVGDIEQIATQLEEYGDEILTQKKQSSLRNIAHFLRAWQGENEGFSRILTMKKYLNEVYPSLSYRNLDPGVLAGDIVNKAHSTILMSGTLYPVSMYKDLLAFNDSTTTVEYESPFPKENRLNLIIPLTTTKFTQRSEEQYRKISSILVEVTDAVPGNCICFFPSYYLRDQVYNFFRYESKKESFEEHPNLQKHEKQQILDNFKAKKDTGAVLFAVTSGSFGEGIDLPGDFLKAVIVIGLPLDRPDLETKELISYFDKKFKKGWEYGYTIPAFNKVLQNAGRCIRSKDDKGVIIFLDERYAWSNYYKYFPKDWHMKITQLYKDRIVKFFDGHV